MSSTLDTKPVETAIDDAWRSVLADTKTAITTDAALPLEGNQWISAPILSYPVDGGTGAVFKGFNCFSLMRHMKNHLLDSGEWDNRFYTPTQAKRLGLELIGKPEPCRVLGYMTHSESNRSPLEKAVFTYHHVYHAGAFKEVPEQPSLDELNVANQHFVTDDALLSQFGEFASTTGMKVEFVTNSLVEYDIEHHTAKMPHPHLFSSSEAFVSVAVHVFAMGAGHEQGLGYYQRFSALPKKERAARHSLVAELSMMMFSRKILRLLPPLFKGSRFAQLLGECKKQDQALLDCLVLADVVSDYLISASNLMTTIAHYQDEIEQQLHQRFKSADDRFNEKSKERCIMKSEPQILTFN